MSCVMGCDTLSCELRLVVNIYFFFFCKIRFKARGWCTVKTKPKSRVIKYLYFFCIPILDRTREEIQFHKKKSYLRSALCAHIVYVQYKGANTRSLVNGNIGCDVGSHVRKKDIIHKSILYLIHSSSISFTYSVRKIRFIGKPLGDVKMIVQVRIE